MAIWVRDKSGNVLVEVFEFNMEYSGEIWGYNHLDKYSKGYLLGSYRSREKGLKVLDMIEKFIIKNQSNLLHAIYKEPNKDADKCIIFHMPQDDEVK